MSPEPARSSIPVAQPAEAPSSIVAQPLEYARPIGPRFGVRRWVLIANYVSLAILLFTVIWTVAESVEIIMITGAILASIGLAMMVAGSIGGSRLTLLGGVIHVGFCALTFALIFWNGWSPSEATVPCLILMGVYAAAIGATMVRERLTRHRA